MSKKDYKDTILVPDSPTIPGLVFRRFRGPEDYPRILSVLEKMRKTDGFEFAITVEDLEMEFKHMEHCNPDEDMLFAEINGDLIGVSQVWWDKDPSGPLLYCHFVDLVPRWRGKGIIHAMLRWNERRLREIAVEHKEEVPRFFHVFARDSEEHWRAVLLDEGYDVYRYGFSMVRPDLENIPNLPLPDGIEVRPVKPEHYSKILNAWNEACKEMRGQIPISEENFKAYLQTPRCDPSLWQIAWHGDDVIGTTFGIINEEENTLNNRKRGYTELISVARPWRGKGIAKALIARCFKILKDRDMTEAALGVDAENPSGALQLYKSMGFKVVKRVAFYRKVLD